jgi:hypothetical protein
MTQRRNRRVAMTPDEVDAFLAEQRTCRVATAGPHVTPLWFLWHGGALWLWSVTRSRRWAELARDPRVAVVVDTGEEYGELRGVELTGTAAPVGPVPRPPDVAAPETAEVEERYAAKYTGGFFVVDGRHGWLKVVPSHVVSWDFRKLR